MGDVPSASTDWLLPRQKTYARAMTVGHGVRQAPNQWEHGWRRPWACGKLRLLFGFQGWPSGVLEIASWAKRECLAAPAIVPLRPDASVAEESLTAIRRHASAKPHESRHFHPDGSPSEAMREAVAVLGGQFVQWLLAKEPHVVGLRIEGGGFEEVRRCVRAVRRIFDATIVLGGPTATSHPREVLDGCDADYVFVGEAEETFNQFLRLAREPNSIDRAAEIPGLTYRYGGRTFSNTLPCDGYERTVLDADGAMAGRRYRSMRNLVRPTAPAALIAANRLDWSLWQGDAGPFESLYFTGGRGCPGDCTFCSKLHGQELRIKSAEQLLEEIEAADALVAQGRIELTRWQLFKYAEDPTRAADRVGWAAIFDEDFLLHRPRALEFFRLWDRSPLARGYRLSIQTNPCSLLDSDGRPHRGLFEWIERVKPMVQVGGESFNPELLLRWHKRHRVEQLEVVLGALDRTRQDYTVFQLLTDYESTPEEVVETLRQLVLHASQHRRMRIASSPYTIPLYDSDTRKSLDHGGRLAGEKIRHFTDYESPQPGWMDPLAADLADLADAELHWALELEHRDGALAASFEAIVEGIGRENARLRQDACAARNRKQRIDHLHEQARFALMEVKEARFRAVFP